MEERNHSLDVLRGLLLVMITINHIGGPVSLFTFQPIGFVSAAEGFVFLSGYVFALANGKYRFRPENLTFSMVSKRAGKIYSYHLMVLLILIVPYAAAPSFMDLWRFPQLAQLVERPDIFAPAYSLLLFRPLHLDILPMYVMFTFLGFMGLKAFFRNKEKLVLSVSVMLWLLSQSAWFASFIPREIRYNLGYFNLFSWQVLFFFGCYFGYSRRINRKVISESRLLRYSTIALFFAFAFIRYSKSFSAGNIELISFLTEKPDLRIFRILNFFVLAYMINWAISSGYFIKSKALELLGSHSLQVFSFQIILVYMYFPFRAEMNSMPLLVKILPQLVAVLLIFIPAILHKEVVNYRADKKYSASLNHDLKELVR
jgi:hypothetical protein